MDVGVFCDDDTMPKDSMLATQWRDLHIPMGERADRPLDAHDTMRGRIEAAGFINVHQQDYKCPLGTWPSLQVYKDAGRACKQQFKQGMEGWVMWLFTHVCVLPNLDEDDANTPNSTVSQTHGLQSRSRSFLLVFERSLMQAGTSTIRPEESGPRSRTMRILRLKASLRSRTSRTSRTQGLWRVRVRRPKDRQRSRRLRVQVLQRKPKPPHHQ